MANVYKLKENIYQHVVIGTGTEYEQAFQITNFLNMLYDTISMRPHSYHYDPCVKNLNSYIKSLKKYIPENADEVWYGDDTFNHTFNLITSELDLIVDHIKLNEDIKNKLNINNIDKQVEDMLINIIESNKRICYFKLGECYNMIKSLYPVEYFD